MRLDSGFHGLDSGFQGLDSRFQSPGFWNPKAKKCWILDSLTWGEIVTSFQRHVPYSYQLCLRSQVPASPISHPCVPYLKSQGIPTSHVPKRAFLHLHPTFSHSLSYRLKTFNIVLLSMLSHRFVGGGESRRI